MNEHLTIKNWNLDDRPREKLQQKGVQSLSDAELLAIILGSGNQNESAVSLAQKMLHKNNHNLTELANKNLHQLQEFKGIGLAKAIGIIACFELGKRRNFNHFKSISKITSSKDVNDLFYSDLAHLHHEEFWILHLNNNHTVLEKQCISKGSLTATLVDVRIILKKALELLSTSIILIHNHPSGNTQPSEADKNITQKIINSSQTFDIKVLDHIIIGEKNYFSFADEGIL